MGTFYHYLRKQSGTRTVRRLVCVDCEATVNRAVRTAGDSVHSFRLGVARFRRLPAISDKITRDLTFTSPEQFWSAFDAFLSPRETTYLYAHNAAYDFTLLGLWSMLCGRDITLESFVIGDPPTVLHIHMERGRAILCDVLNYWRAPIGELGKSVGLPCMEPRREDCTSAEATIRCARHVEIIDKALLGAIREAHCQCNWATTAPGLAWSIFRTKYLESDRALLIHAHPEALQLERLAYHGGHAAIHRAGDINNDVFQYDANSLYPSVMASKTYPRKLVSVRECRGLADLRAACARGPTLALVRVRTKDRQYVVKHQGHLVLAEGEYDTVMCGDELQYAAESGDVTKAWLICEYERGDLFGRYVSDIYERRLSCKRRGDMAGESYNKILLNSLYGKFGQHGTRWAACNGVVPPGAYGTFVVADSKTRTPRSYRCVAYAVQEQIEAGEWIHSMPAISAMVTANARQYMYGIASQLPAYSIYYEDADALHVDARAHSHLQAIGIVDSERLGAMKLVRSADRAVYYAPRNYVLGSHRVRSAVSWAAEEVSDGVFLQDQCQGLSSILATEPRATVRVTNRTIRVSQDAYLLRADSEGWIAPLRLTLPTDVVERPGMLDLFRKQQ